MANPTGYMDKERAENFQATMDGLATETRERHKSFVASNRAYAKTLGKFDQH
jgi:hypothetical protein